jgi:translation elongation factor EF-Tu-like GTPase
LAVANYHETYGCFPPAYVADRDGKPMHSWRVLILPFLEQQELYHAYNFAEPWDGPNNRKLMEARDLLAKFGYDGENTPFVCGNARAALERPGDADASECIRALLDALDHRIPDPKRATDRPFLMPIEGVHTIEGRGTVATGKVEQGVIAPGTKVEILGLGDTLEVVVTSVEQFNRQRVRSQNGVTPR